MNIGEAAGWALGVYAVWAAAVSIVCFAAYGVDKSAARRNRRRIAERTLHRLELIGGWPGALLARRVFRHKSRKLSYRVVFALIVAVHLFIVAALLWLWVR